MEMRGFEEITWTKSVRYLYNFECLIIISRVNAPVNDSLRFFKSFFFVSNIQAEQNITYYLLIIKVINKSKLDKANKFKLYVFLVKILFP